MKRRLHKLKYQTATPPPRFTEATLSIPEWHMVNRIRQLANNGDKRIIIEFRNDYPMVKREKPKE